MSLALHGFSVIIFSISGFIKRQVYRSKALDVNYLLHIGYIGFQLEHVLLSRDQAQEGGFRFALFARFPLLFSVHEIIVQQDGTILPRGNGTPKTLNLPGKELRWNIEWVTQPALTPDFIVEDMTLFASLKFRVLRECLGTVEEMVAGVPTLFVLNG